VSVVVLHDLGDPAGGARWRAAAPADWIAPDLPGHGATPAVRTGHYDPLAIAAIARWTIPDAATATLMGVRRNAHAAVVAAVAGECARLVIVDGLWGPWRTPAAEVDAFYAYVRRIASDPGATAAAPAHGLDPRAAHGYGVFAGATFAQQVWGAVDQPVLVVETPRSATPESERAERISWFAGPVTLVTAPDDEPAIVAAIETWLGADAETETREASIDQNS
jgi:pimeloyl-ACP methyl ester carboxylesterase